MKYFDFHTHILFKQIFAENPNVNSMITDGDLTGIPRLCTDLGNIIESQIHQAFLADFGEEVILGAVLYGLESHLAEQVMPLRNYLKQSARHKVSADLLNGVAANTYKAFSDFTLNRTLQPYLDAKETFNILKKSSFRNPLPPHKVNVFFVVEGCHSFVDSVNAYEGSNRFEPREILKNLDKLLEKVWVLSVNLTHMQQSNLCNHAFAIQLTDIKPFIPRENGLQDDGRKVVQGLFDREICVDLKHMSVKSRHDLMNEITAGMYNNVQPLVCTHAAFTGMAFRDWHGFITVKRTIQNQWYLEIAKTKQIRNSPTQDNAPTFNSSTINLFDEEIVWIVQNKGMIGLSMDRRILGYVDQFDDSPAGIRDGATFVVDKEYFSKAEWTDLGLDNKPTGNFASEDDCLQYDDLVANLNNNHAREEYFYDHILLQLKHYLQVCQTAGIPLSQSTKRICIGSDYDGLINPFLNMSTVKDIPDLKKYIQNNFMYYLKSLTDSEIWAEELDVDQFCEDLFYNNGRDFVKSRF